MEQFTRHPKIDFLSFFPIDFNSTALFKNAFLGLDLAGKPFGGDFEQLSPCKMKKHMLPIAKLASGLPSGRTPPSPRESFYSIQGFQHGRKPTNLALILHHSRCPTWKEAHQPGYRNTQCFQHSRKRANLAIILQHSSFPTWKEAH